MGRNGAGKSTLLKLLVEELKPSDGLVSRKSKLGVSMFSQHHVDQLELSKTPLEEMKGLLDLGDGRDDVQTCRQRCATCPPSRASRACPAACGLSRSRCGDRIGAFGITGELATNPIAVLSGGQKARVQFARVCAPQPHILVLDEPTNHLGKTALCQPARSRLTFALAADLESIRSLAAAVKKFEGAVVIVSHDEQLLSLACSQLWSVLLTRTPLPFAGGGRLIGFVARVFCAGTATVRVAWCSYTTASTSTKTGCGRARTCRRSDHFLH